MGKAKSSKVEPKDPNEVRVRGEDGELLSKTLARITLEPSIRHAMLVSAYGSETFASDNPASIEDCALLIKETLKNAEDGDKALASHLLASQAMTLDVIFTEMARRSGINAGKHPDAQERYMRLALKAQSNCRATLDTLGKMHQPREQTVKHVHVNDGGQAVVADQFHHHMEGGPNEKSGKQSHATSPANKSATLLSQNEDGNDLPISSGKGKEAMQDARGH